MRIKTMLPLVVTLAISIWPSAHAGEEPKPANAEAETSAEAKAKADYDAAEKAAKEAEAAVGPLRDAMKKADMAYAIRSGRESSRGGGSRGRSAEGRSRKNAGGVFLAARNVANEKRALAEQAKARATPAGRRQAGGKPYGES